MNNITDFDNAVLVPSVDVQVGDNKTRAGLKRKRTRNHVHNIPWTASRCSRLLRTLTSRLNILYRLASPREDLFPVQPFADSIVHTSQPSRAQSLPASSSPPTRSPDSPAWIPERASNTAKKTYARGTKARSLPQKPSVPVHTFSTPMVKRMLQPAQIIDRGSLCSTPAAVRADVPQRKSRTLPLKPTSSLDEAQRNLVAAFETFLISTRPATPVARIGASSLLHMCLKKVPLCIDLETQSRNSEEDEDAGFDVAFDLYTDLETLGSHPNGGWYGLRNVIRAHGLHKVSNAIIEGILPQNISFALLDICISLKAVHEGQILLDAIVRGGSCVGVALINKALDLSARFDSESYFLALMATCLTERHIQLSELLGAPRVCRILFRQLACGQEQASTMSLLQAVVFAAGPQMHSKPLRYVFTMLTAMAARKGDSNAVDTTSRPASDVLRTLAVGYWQTNRNSPLCAAHVGQWLYISNLILECLDSTRRPNIATLHIDTLYRHLPVRMLTQGGPSAAQNSMATYICEILQHFDRVEPGASDNLLQAIVKGAVQTSQGASVKAAGFLKDMLLNSAVALGESRDEGLDAVLIREIERYSSLVAEQQGPTDGLPMRMYWEEGLHEWVLAPEIEAAARVSSRARTIFKKTRSVTFFEDDVPTTSVHRQPSRDADSENVDPLACMDDIPSKSHLKSSLTRSETQPLTATPERSTEQRLPLSPVSVNAVKARRKRPSILAKALNKTNENIPVRAELNADDDELVLDVPLPKKRSSFDLRAWSVRSECEKHAYRKEDDLHNGHDCDFSDDELGL